MQWSSLKSSFCLPVKQIFFPWIWSAHFHSNIISELERVIKSWAKCFKRLIYLLIFLLLWTITINHPLHEELQCHFPLRDLIQPHFTASVSSRGWNHVHICVRANVWDCVYLCMCCSWWSDKDFIPNRLLNITLTAAILLFFSCGLQSNSNLHK